MDAIVARIKGFVLRADDSLEDNDFLDFVIDEVIDRAMIYMNRDSLVVQYEEDVSDYGEPDADGQTTTEEDFWNNYDEYPIPPRLEKPLAQTIVQTVQTLTERKDMEVGAITSIDDNGQKVSFSNEVTSYFSSSNDADIFAGISTLLNRYRLGKVIGGYYKRKRDNSYPF